MKPNCPSFILDLDRKIYRQANDLKMTGHMMFCENTLSEYSKISI